MDGGLATTTIWNREIRPSSDPDGEGTETPETPFTEENE